MLYKRSYGFNLNFKNMQCHCQYSAFVSFHLKIISILKCTFFTPVSKIIFCKL